MLAEEKRPTAAKSAWVKRGAGSVGSGVCFPCLNTSKAVLAFRPHQGSSKECSCLLV